MQSLSDIPGNEYLNQNTYSLSKISLDTDISLSKTLVSVLLDLNEGAMKLMNLSKYEEALDKLNQAETFITNLE